MNTKKTDTIRSLRRDGHSEIANQVESWRSTSDNNCGWDRWFVSQFPELAVQYDVGQHATTRKAKKTELKPGNPLTYADHEVSSKSASDVLDIVANGVSRDSNRQFDVYCFADYRGDKSDRSGGIAVALGMPSNGIIHIDNVVSRETLSKFWRDLLVRIDRTGARLIFGQDHQYGVPKGLLDELEINGPWRTAMTAIFWGDHFGDHARHGKAGDFAAEFNRALVQDGKTEYFYSQTKSKSYGIPKTWPRRDDAHKYRLTEKSRGRLPFPFAQLGDNGSVGGQSIVGIPNILSLLNSNEGQGVFAWPFDGTDLPDSVRHVLVEVYPSAMRPSSIPQTDLNDAIACVEWCMREDSEGLLRKHLSSDAIPQCAENEATVRLEGWYLG